MNSPRIGALLAILLPAAGCARGGQTGDEWQSRSGCEEVSRQIVARDAVSPLGFAPAEPLAVLAGAHSTSMRWVPTTNQLDFGPESGDGTVSLTAMPTGDVVWIQFKAAPGVRSTCPSKLETPATVTLTTAGGALNETFDTTVLLDRATSVQIHHSLPADALAGTFYVDADKLMSGSEATLGLSTLVTRYGLLGSFDISVERRTDDRTTEATGTQIAHWPVDATCDLGSRALFPVDLTEPIGSAAIPTGAQALALVQSATAATLVWPDGRQETIQLIIDSAKDKVCARLDPAGGFDLFARARLTTVDAQTKGSYQVNVTVESAAADVVHLTLNDPCSLVVHKNVADFQQACGDWGFDLSAYSGVRLQMDANVSTTSALSGSIRVLGMIATTCPEGKKCSSTEEVEVGVISVQGGPAGTSP